MKRSENTFLLHGKPIREHILKLAENSNKEFAEKLNPGVEIVLGLRLPDMRKLAAEIAKADWKAYLADAPVVLHGGKNALWTCVGICEAG